MRLAFKECLKFAEGHLEVLGLFNRYPSRNEALNRETSPGEREYLFNA